jgi:succinate dehydrogenase / fumarate reductase cytochrome b subunit
MKTTQRPVFLGLRQIRLPVTGWVSILHRISGVLLVLAIPYAAQLLDRSLRGPEAFAAVAALLGSPFVKLMLLVLAWAFLHHLIAGIRFLMLDIDVGIQRPTARKSAGAAIAAALVLTALVAGGMLL